MTVDEAAPGGPRGDRLETRGMSVATEESAREERSAVADRGPLASFLRDQLHPEASSVRIVDERRPLGGASWETLFVTIEWSEESGDLHSERVVIRRAPESGPLAPYEVGKDATILAALAESDVAVPRLLAWTESPTVFERPFLVSNLVEGDCHDLSQVERWPRWQENRAGLGRAMVEQIAALQRFRWQGTGILDVMGPRGDARARVQTVVDRYFEPLAALAERRELGIPLWRDMANWLVRNVPDLAEEELVLVHGDFRFGNFIWRDDEIVAVLDWERAMLGSPMQDLGFLCMPLSRRKDPTLMGKALSFSDLVRHYEAATDRTVEVAAVQYYAVFWQFLEGINTTRALLQDRTPMISSGVLVQPNLVARQTLELMNDIEAGRATL